MGYCMQQVESSFFILAASVADALAAIKALAGHETITDAGGRHFSWVHDFSDAKDLVEALDCWRWEADMDPTGSIVGLTFNGEKLGDDKVLFEAIAIFVRPGSYISMSGEDGALWRWYFDGTRVHEQFGRVVYDE
jgi:hypothetical protein